MIVALERTRRFAVENIPGYKDKPEYAVTIESLDDIRHWPFVQPDAFKHEPWRFASSDEWPASVTFSSQPSQ